MIRAMIVDDEIPAIGELKEQLAVISNIQIEDTFINSISAVESISEKKPDLVFLDISMPGMNGLEVAWKMMDDSPDTMVVFVTAYDKYAVEAFELNAIDYVLKPIRKERFHKTIEKVLKTINNRKEVINNSSEKIFVKFFGEFEVINSNYSVKWNTAKVKEIFAYLLLRRGEKISRDSIVENIFHDIDNDRAKKYLNTCIYMMRKAIKENNLEEFFKLDLCDNNYNFYVKDVYIDIDDFKDKTNVALKNQSLELMEEALKMHDDILKGFDSIWVLAEQENIEMLYEKLLEFYIGMLIQKGNYNKAEEFLNFQLKKNPLNYLLNHWMAKLLEKSGEVRKSKRYFKKCSEDL